MYRDPVCQTEIDAGEAADKGLVSEQYGKLFYFCCDQCREDFESDPEIYIGFHDPGREAGDGMGGYPSSNE